MLFLGLPWVSALKPFCLNYQRGNKLECSALECLESQVNICRTIIKWSLLLYNTLCLTLCHHLEWAVHVLMEKHASLLFKSLNGMGTFYRVDLMSAVFSLNGRFFLSQVVKLLRSIRTDFSLRLCHKIKSRSKFTARIFKRNEL